MKTATQSGVLGELITVREAARLVPGRTSPWTIWSWARNGIAVGDQRLYLKIYKLGKRLLVHPDDLKEFALEAGRAQAQAWAAEREAEAAAR